ncbi:MAG: FixH family protein [Pseudomonadales bacterium]
MLWAAPSLTWAHGGVSFEDDQCLIQVGFFRGHFTAFQPRSRGHTQFCEDLPEIGETVFVLEYLHDGLADLPLEFRIIRDVTGLGRFVRWDDVLAIEDLDAATVFHQQPLLEPDAYAVIHTFKEAGDYVGIVTTRHPDTGILYTAVFPFAVGEGVPIAWIVGALVLLLLAGLVMTRRLLPARPLVPVQMVLAGLALWILPTGEARGQETFPLVATTDHFELRIAPQLWPLRINQIHAWDVYLLTRDGTPVQGAEISLLGGMPAHDHGLPTSPLSTQRPADGHYLLEGMKFHMNGSWEITITVRVDGVAETVVLALTL